MKTPKTAQARESNNTESNNTDTSGTFSYSRCELPPGMAYQYQNADIAQTRGAPAGAAILGGGTSDTEFGMCPNDLAKEYMEELERLELNQDIRGPDDNNHSGRSKVVSDNNTTLLPTVAEALESSCNSKPVIPPVSKPVIPPGPQPMCGKRKKYWIISLSVLLIVITIACVCGLFLSPDDSTDPLTTAPVVSQEDITTPTTTAAITSTTSTTTAAITSTTSTTTAAITSTPTASGPTLYRLSIEKIVEPTLRGDNTQTFDTAKIGWTYSGWYNLQYNASSPGMFQHITGDSDTDMVEAWNTTLVDVDGVDVLLTTRVRVAITNPEVALELGVGQDCATSWTYSVMLGSTVAPAWTDVFYCDFGDAGVWSFKARSFVDLA